MSAQLDLLDVINSDPMPWALDDRDRILAAWIAAEAIDDGVISPNRVRALLTNDAGNLTVNPRRLAAMYASPLLERIGEVRSDDVHGRNVGAVLNLYRFKVDAA